MTPETVRDVLMAQWREKHERWLEDIAVAILTAVLPKLRVAREIRKQARVWKGTASDIAILEPVGKEDNR